MSLPRGGAVQRALALPLLLALVACAGKAPEPPHAGPTPPATSAAVAVAVATPRVVIETTAGARHAVTVELARSEAEHERGLMYRRELGEDAGMLFVFDEAAPRSFWMKNTLIPLDMLFIDDAGVVAGIVRDAAPLTLSPRGPGPGVDARFVLEVRGGWAARHGVAPGARVQLENVPRY